MGKPDFMVFAAFYGDMVIGGLTAHVLTSYFYPTADVYILDLGVKTQFQRMGVGKRLMKAIIDDCKMLGIHEIFVQADEADQHAVDFYHSLGGKAGKAVNFDFPLSS